VKKISVIIPYARRIKNIEMVLDGLGHQTMENKDFEIVIGCLEVSEELAQMINRKYSHLNIVTIMTIETWNTARARNIALRMAEGEVITLIDADIIVDNNFLSRCYENHRLEKNPSFSLYQVLNYSEWDERKTEERELFSYYNKNYLWMDETQNIELSKDSRFEGKINIPWAMCWTGLVSFRMETIREKNLYFDSLFKGWGTEDLEWGLRALKSGVSLEFKREGFGIHIPHGRNSELNHMYEAKNYMNLIKKWPSVEVELVAKLGDLKANEEVLVLREELEKFNYQDEKYSLVSFKEGERTNLLIGAKVQEGRVVNLKDFELESSEVEVGERIKALGVSIPYEENSFDRVHIAKKIFDLSCI